MLVPPAAFFFLAGSCMCWYPRFFFGREVACVGTRVFLAGSCMASVLHLPLLFIIRLLVKQVKSLKTTQN